jgi:hypothetical protein
VCIPLFEEETIIYYVWRIDVCGAENWAPQNVDQKYWEDWNVVLEKDGEDQLGRSCGKWSVSQSQRGNVQGDQKVSVHLMIATHIFLASLLGSTWLLGSRPPGPGGHYTHTNAICYL